jgi:hypothetical protein
VCNEYDWSAIAAAKRPAEEEHRAWLEADLMTLRAVGEWRRSGERADARRQWLDMSNGIIVESVMLSSAWPETQVVVTCTWEQAPGCRYAFHRPIWTVETMFGERPGERELFSVHLIEHFAKRALTRMRSANPGITMHLDVTPATALLQSPPAPGDPPDALLAAREEQAHRRDALDRASRER